MERTNMLFKMLDELPEIEMEKIKIDSRCDKDFIDTILEKSIYKTRQELFEVIDYDNSLVYNQFDTFEFLSVYNPLNCKKN